MLLLLAPPTPKRHVQEVPVPSQHVIQSFRWTRQFHAWLATHTSRLGLADAAAAVARIIDSCVLSDRAITVTPSRLQHGSSFHPRHGGANGPTSGHRKTVLVIRRRGDFLVECLTRRVSCSATANNVQQIRRGLSEQFCAVYVLFTTCANHTGYS